MAACLGIRTVDAMVGPRAAVRPIRSQLGSGRTVKRYKLARREIRNQLDAVYFRFIRDHDTLDHDSRIDFGGQIRGLAIALAIMRGTSAMDETLASERRIMLTGDDLCMCGHPRLQHMRGTGPCCHVTITNGNLFIDCESCFNFADASGEENTVNDCRSRKVTKT